MAYEEEFIANLQNDFILWDYLIYFMLAIFSMSTMVAFALIISCLLKKLFISKYVNQNPLAFSTPIPSPLRNRRHHQHNDGYDECDC